MNKFKTIIAAALLSLCLSGLVNADTPMVDVNSATAEQLADALFGVGPAKAEAIIAYREANGDFEHIDELINVRGIGMSTVDRNRERIQLGERETE